MQTYTGPAHPNRSGSMASLARCINWFSSSFLIRQRGWIQVCANLDEILRGHSGRRRLSGAFFLGTKPIAMRHWVGRRSSASGRGWGEAAVQLPRAVVDVAQICVAAELGHSSKGWVVPEPSSPATGGLMSNMSRSLSKPADGRRTMDC